MSGDEATAAAAAAAVVLVELERKKAAAVARKAANTAKILGGGEWQRRLGQLVADGTLEAEVRAAEDFLASQLSSMTEPATSNPTATVRSPSEVKEAVDRGVAISGGRLGWLSLPVRAYSELHYKKIQHVFKEKFEGKLHSQNFFQSRC